MKEPSQYDRRTVYIMAVLPPKPDKPTLTPRKSMAEDAADCNARMRKVMYQRGEHVQSIEKLPPKPKPMTRAQRNAADWQAKIDQVMAVMHRGAIVSMAQIGEVMNVRPCSLRPIMQQLVYEGKVIRHQKRDHDRATFEVVK